MMSLTFNNVNYINLYKLFLYNVFYNRLVNQNRNMTWTLMSFWTGIDISIETGKSRGWYFKKETYIICCLVHVFLLNHIIIWIYDFTKIIPFWYILITGKHWGNTRWRGNKSINKHISVSSVFRNSRCKCKLNYLRGRKKNQQVHKIMIKVTEMLAQKLIYVILLLNVAYLIDFSGCFVL